MPNLSDFHGKLGSTMPMCNIDFVNMMEYYPIFAKKNSLLEKDLFALKTRPSMHPRFPLGTMFIIKPKEPPLDGDLILIKIKDKAGISMRTVVIDGPFWQLQSIVRGSSTILYDPELHTIVGVVVKIIYER